MEVLVQQLQHPTSLDEICSSASRSDSLSLCPPLAQEAAASRTFQTTDQTTVSVPTVSMGVSPFRCAAACAATR